MQVAYDRAGVGGYSDEGRRRVLGMIYFRYLRRGLLTFRSNNTPSLDWLFYGTEIYDTSTLECRSHT